MNADVDRLSGGRAVARPVRFRRAPRRLARSVVPAALALVVALQAASAGAGAEPVRAESGATMDSTAETSLLTLTNQARAVAGLRALKKDTSLSGVADWRSLDMLNRDYFAHEIPPSGRMVFAELDRKKICYKLAGENIGWNTYPSAEAVAQIQASFMNSPGHRSNILGRVWDAAGIGAYLAPSGKWMFTVLFSQRCKKK